MITIHYLNGNIVFRINNRCNNILDFKSEKLLSTLIVNDLIGGNCRVLFILESPNKKELSNRFPAAGASGKKLSKLILSQNKYQKIPFGRLLNNQYNYSEIKDELNKYGVMNVSQLPLQIDSIKSEKSKDMLAEIYSKFKTIRNNPFSLNRNCDITSYIESAIKFDFFNRLDLIIENNLLEKIIPLGTVAHSFYSKYLFNSDSISVYGNKHPGRNGLRDLNVKVDS